MQKISTLFLRKIFTNLVVDVKDAFLNFLINLLRCVDESLFDICSRTSRSFHKHQSMFPGERLTLLLLNFATRIQITAGYRKKEAPLYGCVATIFFF